MPSTRPSRPAEPARDTAAEIGRALREARLARGEEIAEAAGRLRIRPDYLGALEEGEPERLPGRTYASGYLRSYGAHLGLDGDALAARLRAAAAGPPPPLNNRAPAARPGGRGAGLAALALLLLGAGLWAGHRAASEGGWGAGPRPDPAPASAPAPEVASSPASSAPRPMYAPPEPYPAAPTGEPVGRPAAVPPPTPGEPPAVPGHAGGPGAAARAGEPVPALSASDHPEGPPPGPAGEPPGPAGALAGAPAVAGPPALAQGPPPAADPGGPPATSPEPSQAALSYAVQLALVRDPADAPGEWRRLARRHPGLAGLEPGPPVAVELPGRGAFHRVLGGAFATRAEARAACDRLRAEGGDCVVVVVAP